MREWVRGRVETFGNARALGVTAKAATGRRSPNSVFLSLFLFSLLL